MITLTPEQHTLLRGAINRTANYLSADMGDASSSEMAEMVIDANRLDSIGNSPESDKLVSSLIKEHGYDKVHKFIVKTFKP